MRFELTVLLVKSQMFLPLNYEPNLPFNDVTMLYLALTVPEFDFNDTDLFQYGVPKAFVYITTPDYNVSGRVTNQRFTIL